MPDRITVPATAVQRDYTDLVRREAIAAGLSPDLALRVVQRESRQNPRAVSPKGAQGLMQLMPTTAKDLGVTDPFDPVQNVRGGVKYLRQMLDRYKGDERLALAAYNAGPGAVDQYGGVPPYAETQAYVGALAQPTDRITVDPRGVQRIAPSARRATPSAPAKPGFFRGVAETALPFTSLTEAKEVGQALVAQPLDSLVAMGKGLVSAQVEQFTKAGQAVSEMVGAPPLSAQQFAAGGEALGRVAAGVLPIVGPVAAETGEAIGRGETAYGVGRAVGMAVPNVVSRGLRGVRPSKLAPGEIPLTRGERTGSSASLFAEALVEKTFPGRKPFRELRARQQQALIQGANQVVDRIAGKGSAGDVYRSGKAMQDVIEETEHLVTESIGGRYKQIDELVATETKRVARTDLVPSQAGLVDEFGRPVQVPQRTMQKVEVGGVQPDTAGLKRFAIPLLRRVRKEAELLPPGQLAPVLESLERIVQAPKRLGYQAFQDARTDLLAIARRHGDPIPGKAGGMAKKLASLTDEAMETAAEKSGITIGPRPLQEFVRETNRLWAESKDAFNESVLAKMVEAAPERVHLLLENASLDDLAAVKKYARGPRLDEIKANLLRTWLSRDVQGESAVQGLVKVPDVAKMRGKVLREAAETYAADGRLQELFGAKDAQDLLVIAKTAEQLATQGKSATAGLMAGTMSASILAGTPIVGLLFGAPGLGTAVGVGGGLGLNLLARLMTKPEGLTSVRRTLHALGTGRLGEIDSAVAQMMDVLRRQEERETRTAVGVPPSRALGAGPVTDVGGPPPAP